MKVSVWWPTPADPFRHFSVEQIDASERYYRPLRRAAAFCLAAKGLCLAVAAMIAGVLTQVSPIGSSGFLARVLIGALLTTVAFRAPAIVVDAWFEYRHQFLLEGHTAVPRGNFLKVVLAYTTIFAVLVGLVAAGFYFVAQRVETWPLLMSVVILISAGIATAAQFGLGSGHKNNETDLPPDVADKLRLIADKFGAPDFTFRLLANDKLESGSVFHRPAAEGFFLANRQGADRNVDLNAFSTGLGPNRRIVLSPGLIAEAPETRDFIVGHELAHQVKHHLPAQAGLTTLLCLVAGWSLAGFIGWAPPWERLGIDSLDPLGLPLVALFLYVVVGVLSPLRSWISRGHERIADTMAAQLLGPPSAQESHRIHSATATDLKPPAWVQLYQSHPTPSERLEFLARFRR